MCQWVRPTEVNTSVHWVIEFKVLGTPMSRWNLPSFIEYIPLSRLAVWLRESDQLLIWVEENRRSWTSRVSRIRCNWTGWQILTSSAFTDIMVEGYIHQIIRTRIYSSECSKHFIVKMCLLIELVQSVMRWQRQLSSVGAEDRLDPRCPASRSYLICPHRSAWWDHKYIWDYVYWIGSNRET